jgi:hypothetical protein
MEGKTDSWCQWYPYIVRWHIKAVKGNIHAIRQKGFKELEEAKNFYEAVSKSYAKKLITPLTVEYYSPTWAQYIPGGTLYEPFMVSYHIKTEEDDIVEIYLKYFTKEEDAKLFYNELPDGNAKKLTSPYKVETNNTQIGIILP